MRELERKADEYAYEVYSTRPLGDDPTDEEIKEAYIQGYKDAKAWHYLSKGDVPEKTDDYLVYLERDGVGNIIIATYYVGAEEWCFCGDEMLEPIAWMPLPDLPKE